MGWQGSNLRMAASKAAALPLGDTPIRWAYPPHPFRTFWRDMNRAKEGHLATFLQWQLPKRGNFRSIDRLCHPTMCVSGAIAALDIDQFGPQLAVGLCCPVTAGANGETVITAWLLDAADRCHDRCGPAWQNASTSLPDVASARPLVDGIAFFADTLKPCSPRQLNENRFARDALQNRAGSSWRCDASVPSSNRKNRFMPPSSSIKAMFGRIEKNDLVATVGEWLRIGQPRTGRHSCRRILQHPCRRGPRGYNVRIPRS